MDDPYEEEGQESEEYSENLPLDELLDVLRNNPEDEAIQKRVANYHMYCNTYLVDLARGGSEEGGWYYSYGEPITCVVWTSVAEEAARKWVEDNNLGRREISSVLSEGRYRVNIENHPAEHFPNVRPTYE